MMAVTLLLFACSGREHLLRETWRAFAPRFAPLFTKRILAVDGPISADVIDLISPDLLVQNVERSGYVRSISQALALVETDFFFWLEEDWLFHPDVNLAEGLAALEQHPDWIQLRWSKVAPLAEADAVLAPGIRFSSVGFSANPCLCRTALVREGWAALRAGPPDPSLTFEVFLCRWCEKTGRVCAVVDPGKVPSVVHRGFLEATERQWHMTESLEKKPIHYFPYLTKPGQPPNFFRYRILMVGKMVLVCLRLAFSQLFRLSRYDLCLRVQLVERDTRHLP